MTLCHACSILKLRHEFILLHTPGNVSLRPVRQSVSGRAGEERHSSPTEHSPHRTLTRVTLMPADTGYLFIQREYKWFNFRKVGSCGIMRAK